MMGECDNMQSVREVELEALHSIYVNELEVDCKDGVATSVALWLHPATADNVDEQYVRLFLIFRLPPMYPDSIPEIIIRNTRGLSDEQVDRVLQKLSTVAESKKGGSMLFELIEAAKELITAENRPSESCAICLNGFMEEDVFTKTECYHYFHSYCLNSYVKSKLDQKSDNEKSKNSDQTLCPVCRVPITFAYSSEGFKEPVEASMALETLESEDDHRKEMEKLYQKQLAQGGIIDVEAEKNKFLLEISDVPADNSTRSQSAETSSAEVEGKDFASAGTDGRNPTAGNKRQFSGYSRSRGGYRQSNNRNYERNNDYRERRRYSPGNRYQHSKSSSSNANGSEVEQLSETTAHSLKISSEETQNSNDYAVNESMHFNAHNRYNRYMRDNRSRNQSNGPKHYFNKPPYWMQRGYNDKNTKFQNGGAAKTDGEDHTTDISSKNDPSEFEEEPNERDGSTENKYPISREPREKAFNKPYAMRGNRPNFRNQSRYYNDRSQHPRFVKNWGSPDHSNSYHRFPESSEGYNSANPDRNFSYRGNRPQNYHQSQKYFGHSKSYHTNVESNEVSQGRVKTSSYPRYKGNHQPSKYASNFHTTGQISSEETRGIDEREKHTNAHEEDLPKRESKFSDSTSGSSKPNSEAQAGSFPKSTKSKGTERPELNHVEKSSISGALRPPPGFANPLKKVVYGLPSVNPPPGFSHS